MSRNTNIRVRRAEERLLGPHLFSMVQKPEEGLVVWVLGVIRWGRGVLANHLSNVQGVVVVLNVGGRPSTSLH